MREHTEYQCNCGTMGCHFCDGGLFHCTVCNGFEGSLTSECFGHKLPEQVLDMVYKEGWDFHDGIWHGPHKCEVCQATMYYNRDTKVYTCYSVHCVQLRRALG